MKDLKAILASENIEITVEESTGVGNWLPAGEYIVTLTNCEFGYSNGFEGQTFKDTTREFHALAIHKESGREVQLTRPLEGFLRFDEVTSEHIKLPKGALKEIGMTATAFGNLSASEKKEKLVGHYTNANGDEIAWNRITKERLRDPDRTKKCLQMCAQLLRAAGVVKVGDKFKIDQMDTMLEGQTVGVNVIVDPKLTTRSGNTFSKVDSFFDPKKAVMKTSATAVEVEDDDDDLTF